MSASGKFYMREHSTQFRVFSRRRLRSRSEDAVAEHIKGLLRVVMLIICRNRQRLLSQAWERWVVNTELFHDYDADMRMILGRQIDAGEKRSELEIEVMFKWCIQKFRMGTLGLAHLVAMSRSKTAVVAALQQCRLEIYAPGETVYLQGDLPRAEDGQFTVLSGVCEFISFDKESMQLLELRSLPETQRHEESRRILQLGRKIDEIHPSNGFGELSSSTSVKRASSVRASPESPLELIVLPKRCVSACQRTSAAPRIAEAIDFLRETSMAHDVPFSELCIGARGMTKKVMRMGTILYRMGDVMDRVYLVVSGEVMLDTDFDAMPPPGEPITFQNLNPEKCYCLSEQSILGDEGLCGFSSTYESTAVVVSETAIVFEVVGDGIKFLLRRFELERYSALAYKDQTMLSPPMRVFENIELLHSAFSSLRRAIGLHLRDRGVKKTTDSEAQQVAKQRVINGASKSKSIKGENESKPGERGPRGGKTVAQAEVDNGESGDKHETAAEGEADAEDSDTESRYDGAPGHAVLSRAALQHALRVKKLVEKRLGDELRALAKESILAHEIMQASGASGGGRSRLTAQAEDKVDRALTSFYARRIEIQETESVESNKLRLADVHRNMNLLMAAAASALERGNVDVQVIPRAHAEEGQGAQESAVGDAETNDAARRTGPLDSDEDDGSDDNVAVGALRALNVDSDDDSLNSTDRNGLKNVMIFREDSNRPVIVRHIFELMSEKERKLRSAHNARNLQNMLHLPLSGSASPKAKSPKATTRAPAARRATAAIVAAPHLLRSPIARPMEARGTILVTETPSLTESAQSTSESTRSVAQPALGALTEFPIKSNFCRVMTNRARRTQALLNQEWQKTYGPANLLNVPDKRATKKPRKVFIDLVSSISSQRNALHESCYLPETKKELLAALRAPVVLGPHERGRFVSADITPRFMRLNSMGRPRLDDGSEESDDDPSVVGNTLNQTGSALLGMDAVNYLSLCIGEEIAVRERARRGQNSSSALMESDSVVSAAHKVIAQRRKKYIFRQLQTIPKAPSRRLNVLPTRQTSNVKPVPVIANAVNNDKIDRAADNAQEVEDSEARIATMASLASFASASSGHLNEIGSDIQEDESLDGSSVHENSIQDGGSIASVGLSSQHSQALAEEEGEEEDEVVDDKPRRNRGGLAIERRLPPPKIKSNQRAERAGPGVSVEELAHSGSPAVPSEGGALLEQGSDNEETQKETGTVEIEAAPPTVENNPSGGARKQSSRKWNRLKTAIHTSYMLSTDRIAKNFERVFTTEAKTCRYLDGKKKSANESRFALSDVPMDSRSTRASSHNATHNDRRGPGDSREDDGAVAKWRQGTVQEIFDTRRGPQVSLPTLAATGSNSIYWSDSSAAAAHPTAATGALSYVQVLTKSRIDDAARRRQRVNNKKS